MDFIAGGLVGRQREGCLMPAHQLGDHLGGAVSIVAAVDLIGGNHKHGLSLRPNPTLIKVQGLIQHYLAPGLDSHDVSDADVRDHRRQRW
jgi:hypothetical protein